MCDEHPSYHSLFITTDDIPRTSIFDLRYGLEVSCTRVGGWQLWDHSVPSGILLAGEYDSKGLRLDVGGHLICDSLSTVELK